MITALTLALVSIAGEDVSPLPIVRPGEVLEAELADDDGTLVTPGLQAAGLLAEHPVVGRPYRLEVDEPGPVHVDLRSHVFDAYLVVLDANGTVIAEDDDGLLGRHARVELALEPGRGVVVVACALHGERGPFTLTVGHGRAPSLDPIARTSAEIADAQRRVDVVESLRGADSSAAAGARAALGTHLHRAGRLTEARPHLERALAIDEARLGPDDREVGRSLSRLGMLLLDVGEFDTALARLERALAIEEAAEPEGPGTTWILNSLALVDKQRGDFASARTRLERALAIDEAAWGRDHPRVASALVTLASIEKLDGRYDEAQAHYERALAIDEATLAPDDPALATTLNNLAGLHKERGRPEAARALYERALAIYEAAFGPDHPWVATALNNLAGIALGEGDDAVAAPMYSRALAIREATYGPVHPEVASSLANLAHLSRLRGEYPTAKALLERAVAIGEAALGPDHPNVARDLTSLAMAHIDVGEYAEAQSCLERARTTLETAFSSDHPELAGCLQTLGTLARLRGDVDDALRHHARALEILETTLGPAHPDVALQLYETATAQKVGGDLQGARGSLERALEILDTGARGSPAVTAYALQGLADVLDQQGEFDTARELFERSVEIQRSIGGEEAPELAVTRQNFANLLKRQGDFDRARRLFEQALAVLERVFGPGHPRTVGTEANLAALLLDLAEPEAASELLTRSAERGRAHTARELAALTEDEGLLYLSVLRNRLDISLSAAVTTPASARATYEGVLAWKAQVLRAAMRGRRALRARMTTEDVERLERLQSITTELARGARSLRLDEPVDARRLDALIATRRDLERALISNGVDASSTPPTWRALRDALPADAALVDLIVRNAYVPMRVDEAGDVRERARWSTPRLTAWITRPTDEAPLRIELGPVERLVEAAKSGAFGGLANARGGGVPRTPDTRELRRLLWDPLAPELDGVRTVFVSPDGALAAVPFEPFVDVDGRYLVEKHGFVYLTDPAQVLHVAGSEAGEPGGDLFAVGGVDYATATPHDRPDDQATDDAVHPARPAAPVAEARGPWATAWSPLPGTLDEVRRVEAHHREAFGADAHARTLLIGAHATEEALVEHMPNAATIHLATHGWFDSDDIDDEPRDGGPNPAATDAIRRITDRQPGLLAGLVCAGANAPPRARRVDAHLTAEEVGWMDLSRADLVVLSACDTGLGRPRSGEGLLGLRRAFLVAGARSVVSSLWAVPDEGTVELMDLFYENHWGRGLGRHEALRAAQLELIDRGRPPRQWAAFVLDGDWR